MYAETLKQMIYHRIVIFILLCINCQYVQAQKIKSFFSPNKLIELIVSQNSEKLISYQVNFKSKEIISPSTIGFTFKKPSFDLRKFNPISIDSSSVDTTWKPLWGEVKEIKNNYKELKIQLEDAGTSGILVQLIFRLFDDGIGLRYTFPKQKNLNHFILENEWTNFKMAGDHTAFWIPGDYDSNEYTYNKSKISEVDAVFAASKEKDLAVTSVIGKNFVQTPLMLKTSEGIYLNIHEAALINYPAMHLHINGLNLTSHLTPDAVGNKAYLQAPFSTPWRTILISDKAENMLASKLILNLNEPSTILDSLNTWIRPQKFIGISWEMHVGKSNWSLENGKHGANTVNVKRYIDFASTHGFDGVLVEGWNRGWQDAFGNWKEEIFDFTTPYQDYQIDSITKYAKSKGLKIIMHHETAGSVTNYERRLDSAFSYQVSKGMNTVKTGYIGKIIPRGEHHDGQWMINHYNREAEKAVTYKIMIDSHESVRPTGLHRTFPNWLSSGAARGSVFNNAPALGIQPSHATILPFTRLIGGPMDFTPGLFHMNLNQFDTLRTQKVRSTLAKQLALYVTIYSPIQMAADLPDNYEQYLDAFQFIKDVSVDWDDTKIISAEPGEYITIARKTKGKDTWFIGSVTNETARNISFSLDFLDAEKTYEAIVYRDDDQADFEKNPEAYAIEKRLVTKASNMTYRLQRGGGCAVSLRKIN